MNTLAVGNVNVSRETFEKLEAFEALVRKWTPKINLIAHSTVPEIWQRHIVDSAQLYAIAPENYEHWVDIGSGGGFPGIVMAILGNAGMPNARFTFIESDQRKATFLRTASRELSLSVKVISERIENVPEQCADVVSARALGALDALMPALQRHLSPNGIALLHKGRRYADEISQAQLNWDFEITDVPSITEPDARLLAIQRISRA